MAATKIPAKKASAKSPATSPHRFEPVKLDALFGALDAVAWMNTPTPTQVAQFAGIDPRTAGKLLKNACQIGLTESLGGGFVLLRPYPYQGTLDEKQTVVREALIKLKLLTAVRQFLRLGDGVDTALRKAATIAGIAPFNAGDLRPLIEWANSLDALQPEIIQEDLVDQAEEKKEERHRASERVVAFLSHSSSDKEFIRQLAGDLKAHEFGVWLDEQHIKVGDSIPEKISQGLAGSDYFVIAVSKNSAGSEWVKKELNNALVNEVQRRKVHILPIKLDDSEMPPAIADKKYADFSKSYKEGLRQLIDAMSGTKDD